MSQPCKLQPWQVPQQLLLVLLVHGFAMYPSLCIKSAQYRHLCWCWNKVGVLGALHHACVDLPICIT